jgi:lipopolysaccharide transport system permease protein
MAALWVNRAAAGGSARVVLDPWAMLRNLWAHRELTAQLAKRDVLVRYREARLGLLWAVLAPLTMLAIYTFVFAVVFQIRWSDRPEETRGEFALTLLCGMLLFNLFAEVVTRAPTMIVANSSYVKKVVFPLEVFVVAGLLSALVRLTIGYGVWLAGWFVIEGAWPHATVALLPLVLLPVCLLTAGVAWVLASVGVFLRDVGPAVQLGVQLLFFATPIFYSLDRVPPPFRGVLEVNPLTHAVEDARRVMMAGAPPEWGWWGSSVLGGAIVLLLGYAFFIRSKRAFADVL